VYRIEYDQLQLKCFLSQYTGNILFALSHHLPSGSLPGIDAVEPNDEDVKQALSAMDIDEDGSTKLNYFVQTYRAGDFPFYGDYAVHRAKEPMTGPRQIIVTK